MEEIIKVIGVGDCGSNAVSKIYEKGVEDVGFIICNTDVQALSISMIPTKIQIGQNITNGFGTGCDPEIGRQAALESLDKINSVLKTEILVIVAGFGGGTGTGAAPVIAKEAKDMGIRVTIAIVTLPFKNEGKEQYKRALDGLQKLKGNVDSLWVINNEKLYEIYPEISTLDPFPISDEIIVNAITCIVAFIIPKAKYISIDIAEIRTMVSNSGIALMGFGQAAGDNRAQEAAKQALSSPLLNNNDISDAKNIIMVFKSGTKKPLKMFELREMVDYITTSLGKLMVDYIRTASGKDINVQRYVIKDESLDDAIAITIIAGFPENKYFLF
jgi:cell division protein FtsZ